MTPPPRAFPTAPGPWVTRSPYNPGPTILIVSDGEKDFSSLQDILTKHGVTAKITPLRPVNEGAVLVND